MNRLGPLLMEKTIYIVKCSFPHSIETKSVLVHHFLSILKEKKIGNDHSTGKYITPDEHFWSALLQLLWEEDIDTQNAIVQ